MSYYLAYIGHQWHAAVAGVMSPVCGCYVIGPGGVPALGINPTSPGWIGQYVGSCSTYKAINNAFNTTQCQNVYYPNGLCLGSDGTACALSSMR